MLLHYMGLVKMVETIKTLIILLLLIGISAVIVWKITGVGA